MQALADRLEISVVALRDRVSELLWHKSGCKEVQWTAKDRVDVAATGFLERWCRRCRIYGCIMHQMTSHLPVRGPVMDRGKADDNRHCGPHCFHNSTASEHSDKTATGTDWSGWELDLLNVGLEIWGRQPCKISPLIGTKQCCQVIRVYLLTKIQQQSHNWFLSIYAGARANGSHAKCSPEPRQRH
jgi:hypothetical protein